LFPPSSYFGIKYEIENNRKNKARFIAKEEDEIAHSYSLSPFLPSYPFHRSLLSF
jgi:hypothetical protein